MPIQATLKSFQAWLSEDCEQVCKLLHNDLRGSQKSPWSWRSICIFLGRASGLQFPSQDGWSVMITALCAQGRGTTPSPYWLKFAWSCLSSRIPPLPPPSLTSNLLWGNVGSRIRCPPTCETFTSPAQPHLTMKLTARSGLKIEQ